MMFKLSRLNLKLFVFFLLFVFVFILGAQRVLADSGGIPQDGTWVKDSDVTYAGKLASRAADLLNWVTSHYQWFYIYPNKVNPFDDVWSTVRNITFALLSLGILAGAFLMIVTRGQSLTVKKFIPRFLIVLALVYLSFPIIAFLYQIVDIIQGFFLQINGRSLSSVDLLNVGFDYNNFVGYKRVGLEFEESAFISILLVKLTAATYYVMFILLVIRKVILWFFIIVSPVFPLLLLFPLLRNSAKIWVGEFFKWLLYAPLFAIFLVGLVSIWKVYIPLQLTIPCDSQDTNLKYPTSINILIGGPCQVLDSKNSLSSPDSFIQYFIALLMLWMVMVLPFILLKIFLNYFNNFEISENNLVKYLVNASSPIIDKYRLRRGPTLPPSNLPPRVPTAGIPPTSGFGGSGLAKNIPSFKDTALGEVEKSMASRSDEISRMSNQTQQLNRGLANAANLSQVAQVFNNKGDDLNSFSQRSNTQQISSLTPQQTEILSLANLSIPKMRDIAKYEAATLSVDASGKDETERIVEALKRISGESAITTPREKEDSSKLREKLVGESKNGNPLAFSILAAAKADQQGEFPEANRVQTVNLEEYEEVKKNWQDNYRKLEPPLGSNGVPKNRVDWVKEDIQKIPQVIDLLLSGDPNKQKVGREMVSKILPFLLLGGFSTQEIIAYLKAKLEAAKVVLAELLQVQESEDTKITVERKKEEVPKQLHAEESLEDSDSLKNSGGS